MKTPIKYENCNLDRQQILGINHTFARLHLPDIDEKNNKSSTVVHSVVYLGETLPLFHFD